MEQRDMNNAAPSERARRASGDGAETKTRKPQRFSARMKSMIVLRHLRSEELRLALLEFKRTYNHGWILQRHGYRTPAQVRHEQIASLQKAA